jgi:hypothetical protein
MSLEEQSAHSDSVSKTKAETGGQDYTTKLTLICTAWIVTALAVGIGFVAFSDVFMSLVA